MTSRLERVAVDIERSATSQVNLSRAMIEFQAACVTSDWDASEVARRRAHDELDSMFDNLAAAYKESNR